MKVHAITKSARGVVLFCLLLPALVFGQTPECQPNALVGQRGGDTSTLIICSVPLRRDPAFIALVKRINEMGASVRGSALALNSATRGLTPQQVTTLAANFARQLEPVLKQGNERTLRELESLRGKLDSFGELVSRVASQPEGRARVQAALSGDAGDAIARLDFSGASEMLTQLALIDHKLDVLVNPPGAEALLPMEVQQAESQWQQFVGMKGEQHCPKVHSLILKLRTDAATAAAQRQFESARRLQMQLRIYAMSANQQLLYEQQQQIRAQQQVVDGRNRLQDLLDALRKELARRERDITSAAGWQPEQESQKREARDHVRAALDHIVAELARANGLTDEQRMDEASRVLQDAMRDASRLRDGKPLQPSTTRTPLRVAMNACF